jgi:hypothetical protein
MPTLRDAVGYCLGVARETGELGPVAYWPSTADRVTGISPGDVPRKPWETEERVRVLSVEIDPDSSRGATAYVEHRHEPGLVFRVELAPAGAVLGFHVRPLVYASTAVPFGGGDVLTTYEVDETSVPDQAEHLTARRLRNLPVGELCDAAIGALRAGPMGYLLQTGAHQVTWRRTLDGQHRPGRRGRPDRFYAEVAAEYVDALAGGRPIKDVSRERFLSASQVRDLVSEARRRGLLTKPPKGRAGGHLTAKARAELDKGA